MKKCTAKMKIKARGDASKPRKKLTLSARKA